MRPFNNYVTLRPREDLEQLWNSSTIITPDTALMGGDQLTGPRNDRACIGEIVAIGPGNADCPDMGDVAVGDIAVLPLHSCSKVVVLKEEICLLVAARALGGIVTDLGKATEKLRPINDYVLTREARAEFERIMFGGLVLPDEFVSDGIPVDGGTEGIVRLVLERCVGTGGGVYTKRALWKPPQRKGELVALNPLPSCRFRRHGQWLRLVPQEDVQFGVGE